MQPAFQRDRSVGGGRVLRIRFSDRSHGDFSTTGPGPDTAPDTAGGDAPPVSEELQQRRQDFVPGEWTWLRQQHGNKVVVVNSPGAHAGAEGDCMATAASSAVLSVTTADCVPVVVVGRGAFALVHVGWRGIRLGVIDAAVRAVRDLQPPFASQRFEVTAVLGPMIRSGSYEFDSSLAAEIAHDIGTEPERITGVTRWGTPSLDLAAAVTWCLTATRVYEVDDMGLDTTDPRFFSHRLRAEPQRQVAAAWLDEVGPEVRVVSTRQMRISRGGTDLRRHK